MSGLQVFSIVYEINAQILLQFLFVWKVGSLQVCCVESRLPRSEDVLLNQSNKVAPHSTMYLW